MLICSKALQVQEAMPQTDLLMQHTGLFIIIYVTMLLDKHWCNASNGCEQLAYVLWTDSRNFPVKAYDICG